MVGVHIGVGVVKTVIEETILIHGLHGILVAIYEAKLILLLAEERILHIVSLLHSVRILVGVLVRLVVVVGVLVHHVESKVAAVVAQHCLENLEYE
jgi:hypothetical protein